MRPIISLSGYGVVLRRDSIDTDQIIPAEYCKRLTKTGYADALFARWREDPDFVLNSPKHANATILLAGKNFGTGSSREHAVWALRDWGFTAVIAPSYGDIFRRNAFKNGLLAIELPDTSVEHLRRLCEVSPEIPIVIDLQSKTLAASQHCFIFEIGDRTRSLIMNGLDEIDVTLMNADDIDRHERRRPGWMPKLTRSDWEPAANLRVEV